MPEYKNIINNQVVISGQEEIRRLEKELKAQAQQSDNLQDSLDRTRETLREVRQELNDLKYNSGFEELEQKANQYESALRRTANELESILVSQHLLKGSFDNYEEFEDDIEEVANGYKTINEALVDIKRRYHDIQSEGSGGPLDETMLEVVLATLQKLGETIDDVSDRLKIMQTEGVKAVSAPADATQSGNSVANMLREIAEASKEMGDGVGESQAPMLTLLQTLNELSNVNGENLMNISRTFSGLANIGHGTFGDTKVEGIINLINRLEEAGATSKAINIRFDVGGLEDLNIKKSSLKNLAEYLPKIADVKADRVKQIFEVNPSNGINNLKVSKAALSNLAEKLPAISKINEKKLAAIFNINTSGINNLKVSKASIDNVTNLARAAEILKNNGIDLTLKGDATEELKKLTQETVDATDAAVKLRAETQGIADSFQSSTQPLEKTQSLLNGISVSVDEFDESKLKQIQWALGKEGVNADDQSRIMSLFKDLNGEITSVTAKYKEFASVGEHVSQVLIQGIDEYGRAFSKAIDWKEYTDVDPLTGDKTPSFGPFISGTIKYNAAKEQLIDTTKAEADVEERLYNIRKQLRQASLSGIDDNNINYQNVQAYADAVREMFTQVDADSTTQKQWLANLDALDAKYRVATLGLKEDTEAAKANAKARGELVRIVEAQAKITTEIDATEKLLRKAQDAGVSDSDKNIVALREHIATMREFRDELDPTTTLQKDFTATFNELSAAATPASTGLKNTIDRAKEYAQAEKEAVDVDEARIEVLKELQRVQDLLNKAYQSGISIDDPHVQALMKAGDELYNYESKIGQAGQTQKEFKAGLDAITVSYREDANVVRTTTKEHEEQNKHLAKGKQVYDEVEKALNKYKDAQTSSNSEVKMAYSEIDKLTGQLITLTARYNDGELSEEEYDKAVREVNDSLKEQIKIVSNAGTSVDQTTSKFAQLAQQLTRFLTPLYMARKAWQTLKEMANVVIELEDAFASLKIVTGATDAELEEFYQTSSKIASELGKSITDIAASIEVFSRLGYALPDATTLAQYATMLSNVANVSTDEATTGLTSIIKGYNMHVDQAEHVADVLVSIGQRYAVSAGEMMEAYEKSGAALAATNTSFEKSAALIASANAAIQNSSIVGKVLPMHTVMYA